MKRANFHWVLPQDSEATPVFKELIQARKIPERIGALLWQRNIRTAEALDAFYQRICNTFMIRFSFMIWIRPWNGSMKPF